MTKIGEVMEIKEASIAVVLFIPKKSSSRFRGAHKNPKKTYGNNFLKDILDFCSLMINGIRTRNEAIKKR